MTASAASYCEEENNNSNILDAAMSPTAAPTTVVDSHRNQHRRNHNRNRSSNNNINKQSATTRNEEEEEERYHPVNTRSSSRSSSSGTPPPTTTNNSNHNNHNRREQQSTLRRHYSISELVETLGREDHHHNHNQHDQLPPELERRTRDFRLAQSKRRQKYGVQKRWGFFGMYYHLQNVRTDLEWSEDAAYRRQHNLPYLSWNDFDTARYTGLKNRPWFTYIIILLCTIMLLVEFAVNEWQIEPMNINPMLGPSRETLLKVGARDTAKIVNDGQWYRVFTPLILHAGIIHYIVNMLALWFIGIAVEQSHGIMNTSVIFLLSGVGANILSAIFLPQYISVGASGSIFGLVGACIADIGLNWKLLFIQNENSGAGNAAAQGGDDGREEGKKQMWRRNASAVSLLVLEIVVNIILGLVTPFIDNWSHLGGFVYGACCAFSIFEPLPVVFFGVDNSTWDKIHMIFVKFLGLIVSVVLIMVSTVWLATSDPGDSPCSKCRYISCVPFPFFSDEKWWYCDDCDFVTANLFQTGGIYDRVDLTCPDEVVETIDISAFAITDKDTVRRNLPTYCRDYCESVFK